jgi:hypothetical protein
LDLLREDFLAFSLNLNLCYVLYAKVTVRILVKPDELLSIANLDRLGLGVKSEFESFVPLLPLFEGSFHSEVPVLAPLKERG